MALLEIKNLSVDFQAKNGVVHAVRNVSYKLDTGEMLGIVGESGSGKSVGMLALMGLLAKNGRVVSGQMLFDGRDISPLAKEFCGDGKAYEKAMEEIRGVQIGMIFQDPMTYLNPVLKIGTQITEGIIKHEYNYQLWLLYHLRTHNKIVEKKPQTHLSLSAHPVSFLRHRKYK